jgi:hypothetical protein
MEPSFPLINTNPTWFRQQLQHYDANRYPQGIIFNAQTHCLQIPRIYLGAHHARGGLVAGDELTALAGKLLPGTGGPALGRAWQIMEEQQDHRTVADCASRLREEVNRPQKTGPLAGLMMMPPEQYLTDVADNLDLRADMVQLRTALDSGRENKPALRALVGHARPYRDRLGYNHIDWGGAFRQQVIDPLIARLNDESINRAAPIHGTKPHPKGYMVNFFDALETYANS